MINSTFLKMADPTPTVTPMMEQYLRLKRGLPEDVFLFFRLGDFYEMFFEDAKAVSELLGLTLTHRQSIPMCGVPHHAAEGYISKLVKQGKRVAIAEQTTQPGQGKLVEREIARVISAGTISDLSMLDDGRNNFIAAVLKIKKIWGLACVDHTTGEFSVAEFDHEDLLKDELGRIAPSELLISAEQEDLLGLEPTLLYDAYTFIPGSATSALCDHFKVQSLDGFGCGDMSASLGAAGAILHYLRFQLRRSTDHILSLSVRSDRDFVQIDTSSLRNLDLVEARGGVRHSLLGAIDRTSTPMGARKLRHWLLHPLKNVESIHARQAMIHAFLQEDYLMSKLRQSLKGIRDLERIIGRLSQGAGNARDLQSLAYSLGRLPDVLADLSAFEEKGGALTRSLISRLGDFGELVEMLNQAIADEPPVSLKEGGLIREGHSAELDELRLAARDGKSWLADLQEKERARTGIDSLKIRFNNVFGYYIEVTKSHYKKVPDDYERKQTLVNAERFVTPALKEMEGTILGAEERARQLEYEEFLELREKVCTRLTDIQVTAESLAEIDILLGLAEVARQYDYTCPLVEDSGVLDIRDGRHPVIEQTLVGGSFVANDTFMEPEENRLILLTGPNMAGKSTYIRQVALIVLLAQIGSFVPAKEARIGVVDKVFCRVGASDDLARGQSTFMVEMSETALILNNATARSLVVLDEIGRGTATFDGLSIAWAVAEHLHDKIECNALFATHYHELTDLSRARSGVQNYNVAVREWHDEIVFLRKILPGTADKSYGIQVARLAGLPNTIIDRAKTILCHLEMNSSRPSTRPKDEPKPKNTRLAAREDVLPDSPSAQLELFDF